MHPLTLVFRIVGLLLIVGLVLGAFALGGLYAIALIAKETGNAPPPQPAEVTILQAPQEQKTATPAPPQKESAESQNRQPAEKTPAQQKVNPPAPEPPGLPNALVGTWSGAFYHDVHGEIPATYVFWQ